jgi:uncharacterized protein YqiB (DUF1249 family)
MKRLPALEVRILHDVLSVAAVTDDPQGRTKKIIDMRKRYALKIFNFDSIAKRH